MTGAMLAMTAVSAAQGYSQSKKAEGAANAAEGWGMEQLGFGQSMLDDWEASFGGIEENLAEYYNNLDPVKYATANKASLRDNMNKQMTQFNDTMASKGLMTSGMRVQAEKEQAFSLAESNAQIDLQAEEQVAGMKQNWLNYGASQKTNAQQTIVGAQSNMQGIKSNQAQMHSQSSQGWYSTAGSFMGMAAGGMGGGMFSGIGSQTAAQGIGSNGSSSYINWNN